MGFLAEDSRDEVYLATLLVSSYSLSAFESLTFSFLHFENLVGRKGGYTFSFVSLRRKIQSISRRMNETYRNCS